MKRYVGLAAVILLLCASNRSSTAQNLPSYMAPIAGKTAATASDTATKDILALNEISNADSLTVGQVLRIPKI